MRMVVIMIFSNKAEHTAQMMLLTLMLVYNYCIYYRLYRISAPAPAPANPESGHFFKNPAKSDSGQISIRICRMPVQLQSVQLITDKLKLTQLTC